MPRRGAARTPPWPRAVEERHGHQGQFGFTTTPLGRHLSAREIWGAAVRRKVHDLQVVGLPCPATPISRSCLAGIFKQFDVLILFTGARR